MKRKAVRPDPQKISTYFFDQLLHDASPSVEGTGAEGSNNKGKRHTSKALPRYCCLESGGNRDEVDEKATAGAVEEPHLLIQSYSEGSPPPEHAVKEFTGGISPSPLPSPQVEPSDANAGIERTGRIAQEGSDTRGLSSSQEQQVGNQGISMVEKSSKAQKEDHEGRSVALSPFWSVAPVTRHPAMDVLLWERYTPKNFQSEFIQFMGEEHHHTRSLVLELEEQGRRVEDVLARNVARRDLFSSDFEQKERWKRTLEELEAMLFWTSDDVVQRYQLNLSLPSQLKGGKGSPPGRRGTERNEPRDKRRGEEEKEKEEQKKNNKSNAMLVHREVEKGAPSDFNPVSSLGMKREREGIKDREKSVFTETTTQTVSSVSSTQHPPLEGDGEEGERESADALVSVKERGGAPLPPPLPSQVESKRGSEEMERGAMKMRMTSGSETGSSSTSTSTQKPSMENTSCSASSSSAREAEEKGGSPVSYFQKFAEEAHIHLQFDTSRGQQAKERKNANMSNSNTKTNQKSMISIAEIDDSPCTGNASLSRPSDKNADPQAPSGDESGSEIPKEKPALGMGKAYQKSKADLLNPSKRPLCLRRLFAPLLQKREQLPKNLTLLLSDVHKCQVEVFPSLEEALTDCSMFHIPLHLPFQIISQYIQRYLTREMPTVAISSAQAHETIVEEMKQESPELENFIRERGEDISYLDNVPTVERHSLAQEMWKKLLATFSRHEIRHHTLLKDYSELTRSSEVELTRLKQALEQCSDTSATAIMQLEEDAKECIGVVKSMTEKTKSMLEEINAQYQKEEEGLRSSLKRKMYQLQRSEAEQERLARRVREAVKALANEQLKYEETAQEVCQERLALAQVQVSYNQLQNAVKTCVEEALATDKRATQIHRMLKKADKTRQFLLTSCRQHVGRLETEDYYRRLGVVDRSCQNMQSWARWLNDAVAVYEDRFEGLTAKTQRVSWQMEFLMSAEREFAVRNLMDSKDAWMLLEERWKEVKALYKELQNDDEAIPPLLDPVHLTSPDAEALRTCMKNLDGPLNVQRQAPRLGELLGNPERSREEVRGMSNAEARMLFHRSAKATLPLSSKTRLRMMTLTLGSNISRSDIPLDGTSNAALVIGDDDNGNKEKESGGGGGGEGVEVEGEGRTVGILAGKSLDERMKDALPSPRLPGYPDEEKKEKQKQKREEEEAIGKEVEPTQGNRRGKHKERLGKREKKTNRNKNAVHEEEEEFHLRGSPPLSYSSSSQMATAVGTASSNIRRRTEMLCTAAPAARAALDAGRSVGLPPSHLGAGQRRTLLEPYHQQFDYLLYPPYTDLVDGIADEKGRSGQEKRTEKDARQDVQSEQQQQQHHYRVLPSVPLPQVEQEEDGRRGVKSISPKVPPPPPFRAAHKNGNSAGFNSTNSGGTGAWRNGYRTSRREDGNSDGTHSLIGKAPGRIPGDLDWREENSSPPSHLSTSLLGEDGSPLTVASTRVLSSTNSTGVSSALLCPSSLNCTPSPLPAPPHPHSSSSSSTLSSSALHIGQQEIGKRLHPLYPSSAGPSRS